MKFYAWFLMLTAALLVGCDQPAAESDPSVTPNSGAAEEGHADHDHADHDHDDADHDHGEHADHEHDEHADHEHSEHEDDHSAQMPMEKIRFVADKKISVPDMMCPYGCWPRVEEALAAQVGVEAVQLAEQPEGTPEGEIKERVVELKLNGEFDEQATLAALKQIDFDASVLN